MVSQNSIRTCIQELLARTFNVHSQNMSISSKLKRLHAFLRWLNEDQLRVCATPAGLGRATLDRGGMDDSPGGWSRDVSIIIVKENPRQRLFRYHRPPGLAFSSCVLAKFIGVSVVLYNRGKSTAYPVPRLGAASFHEYTLMTV